MEKYLPQFLYAFVITLVFITLLRRAAPHLGLIDVPGGRKQHGSVTPVVGGLAIFLAVITGASALGIPFTEYASFFGGIALLVAVGTMDDIADMPAVGKLVVQIGAAGGAIWSGGMVIRDLGGMLGGESLPLVGMALPFTLIWAVGLINAVNMIDGLDGLAGGLCFVALMWLTVGALAGGAEQSSLLLICIMVALMGFLVFNMRHPWRKRAAIFMGDAGSMALGFCLAWFTVTLSQAPNRALPPIVMAWIVALPMMDTLSLILRRLLDGRSPFSADREHLHHLLLDAGLPVERAVALIVAAAAAMGGAGMAGWYFKLPEPLMLHGLIVVFQVYLLAVWFASRDRRLTVGEEEQPV